MSNVPAYPKNPALHPTSAPPESTVVHPTLPLDQTTNSIQSLNLWQGFDIRGLVDRAPIPAVLIAAGVGFLVGSRRFGSFL